MITVERADDAQGGHDTFPADEACRIALTDEERDDVEAALTTLPRVRPERLPRPASTLLRAGARLPTRVVDGLLAFRGHGNPTGALLLHNLPIDADLPVTPVDGRRTSDKPTSTSEGVLLSVMSLLGDIIAYVAEKDGAFVQEVTPIRGMEARQENSGSVSFDLHTENAFHPFPPDYVGLICLREDPGNGAWSMVCPIAAAIGRLNRRTIEILRRPVYAVRPPSSFPAGSSMLRDVPVISGPADDPVLRVDFHNSVAPDAATAAALVDLRVAMDDAALMVRLRPGDLLITDNLVAAHGRSGFQPRYDGHDRWLQRAFAVRDLRASRGRRSRHSHRVN